MKIFVVFPSFGYWEIGIIAFALWALALLDICYSHDDNITLTWDHNTQPDLDHYEVNISYNIKGVGYLKIEKVDKTINTYTFENHLDGIRYTFCVKAFDNKGRPSECSNIEKIRLCEADINKDGTVDVRDYYLYLEMFSASFLKSDCYVSEVK